MRRIWSALKILGLEILVAATIWLAAAIILGIGVEFSVLRIPSWIVGMPFLLGAPAYALVGVLLFLRALVEPYDNYKPIYKRLLSVFKR